MNTTDLLSSIDSELARLREVRALLTGQNGHVRPGQKPGKKQTMNADARARIAAAQRKRWAAWKKAAKKALTGYCLIPICIYPIGVSC